jgi:hypothetical protein
MFMDNLTNPKKVTLFHNFSVNAGSIPLVNILQDVKNGVHATVINTLRQSVEKGDKSNAERIKKSLPGFTASAQYSGARKPENIVEYSGIIILDIDHAGKENIAELRSKAATVPNTVFSFRSPSGDGLKIGVMPSSSMPLTKENHLYNYSVTADYYEHLLGVKIDRSGKDIGRLCFVSFDTDIYINLNPEEGTLVKFDEAAVINDDCAQGGNAEEKRDALPLRCVFSSVKKRVIRKLGAYREGNRNNFIFNMSCLCKERNVSIEDVKMYCVNNFRDMSVDELMKTVENGYRYAPGDAKMDASASKMDAGESKMDASESKMDAGASKMDASESKMDAGESTKEAEATGKRPNGVPESKEKAQKPDAAEKRVEQEFMLKKLYDFRWNTVTRQVEYREIGGVEWNVLSDYAENSISRKLCLEMGVVVPPKALHEIVVSDFSPRFHPFQDYFDRLPVWDCTTDHIGALAASVKTTNQPLWERGFRMWLVGMVACAVNEMANNHIVLILQSDEQGIGKTTFLRNLLPADLQNYYASGVPDLNSKDTGLMLARMMLINFDELEAFSKQELNRFKELITRLVISERAPYARNTEHFVRHASICASSNNRQLLSDPSGSRRFFCNTVISIDSSFKIDHAAIYAQAYALYKSGFRYWFDKEDIELINRHNTAFKVCSYEEELLMTHFEQAVSTQDGNYLSASQIANIIYAKTGVNLDRGSLQRLGSILTNSGYRHHEAKGRRLYLIREKTDFEKENDRKHPDGSPETPQLPF